LIPWFIYGIAFYGNFLGAFIHGGVAAKYWGGVQGHLFYFKYWFMMFSAIGILFLFGLASEIKKKFRERGSLFMGIFFFVFLFFSFFIAHKEQRFLLPLVIPVCILSARYISRIGKKELIIGIVSVIAIGSIASQGYYLFSDSYNGNNKCYGEALDFIAEIPGDVLVINDESAVVYFYTGKRTAFLPGKSVENIQGRAKGEETYLLYTSVNMPLYIEENEEALIEWENNFERIFECDWDWGLSRIYKIS